MFKRLLKSRHDARHSKDLREPTLPNVENGPSVKGAPWAVGDSCSPTPSVGPVEYSLESPNYRPHSYDSINPVEYQQSPLETPYAVPLPSIDPVEYRHSPLVSGPSNASGAPDPEPTKPNDYRAGTPQPVPTPAAQLKVVTKPQRLTPQPPTPKRYTYTVDHPPPKLDYETKRAYFAALAEQQPAELPASAVPPRYELPTASTPRQTPAPPYSPTQHVQSPTYPRSPVSDRSSTTTLVASPRSELPSPRLGHRKSNIITSPVSDGNEGIKKFVLDIYCPLKCDAHGNRREQIPRDVREFRLSKVALIPIVAGSRTFVSFDVVFGAVDKPYADIVEKHFSCSHRTRLTEVEQGAIHGGQVYTIGPLNIAYRDGESATVYVKFPTPEDKRDFQAAFWDMWPYVEQPAE